MDIYAILLCIQLNDNFKRLMQQRNKIPVLDFYHDRVSMALWPKFTQMFTVYIDSVKKAQPKHFRVYTNPSVHSVTTKYVNFVSGVYKLADCCVSGQDMIMHRLSILKQEITNLIMKMSQEHFGANSTKLPLVFMINNVNFIVSSL